MARDAAGASRRDAAGASRRDARAIFVAQAFRAFAYGLGSVLLAVTLEDRGYSGTTVGLVLAAVVAGTVGAQLAVARWGERIGRRRAYAALYLGLAAAGVAFALADQAWVLVLAALTGTMSTEVVETGAFTSLEQSMLSEELRGHDRTRAFSTYNAVAALAGSLGALAAGGPSLVRRWVPSLPGDERMFLLFVPVALVGAVLASRLSERVESPPVLAGVGTPRPGLDRSRPTVARLAGLMACDSFGGGFVVQAFLAFWLRDRFGLSTATLGAVFSVIGVLQTLSFLAAAPLARRFGLLNTMVFTHLPSNVLLLCVPLAPNAVTAVGLLFARFCLSQMDVPTRQAYVMALVDPAERTAAAAYTNTVRYAVKPVGAVLGGAAYQAAAGLPFFVGGGTKIVYDLALWRWFRTVPLPEEQAS